MGLLEDAIAAGDVGAQQQLSSFFAGGNQPGYNDWQPSNAAGGNLSLTDPAKIRAYSELNARAASEQAMNMRRQYEQDRMIKVMGAIKGLEPEAQQQLLQRLGLVPPGAAQRPSQKLREGMALATQKHALEAPDRAEKLDLQRTNIASQVENRTAQQGIAQQMNDMR